ncbi:PHD finger protein [Geosmithia morbida]|uniref:PHD finger protein n=1 Tax=Geosmithia morbida TaxID=1094350 RepID=A0A9P5D2I6_9HYPO|nr:PHD finger protein [Geosmithia morbida]KAF4123902.1 PHD finger protein [Geosmithia morbida]
MASSTHASTWTATRDDAARQADETDPTTGTATATEIHTYGDEGKTRSVSPASQPPYVPQFSAATALILDRIKAGTKGGFNSALSDASASTPRPDRDAYEDARSRLVRSMRTEYFYAMKKTDVLNVLSFCDQLKPQLLVDIMVSVSKRHPDLPMFNSPDWEVAASASASITEQQKKRQQQQLLHRRRSPLGSRSRHGHSLLNSKARQNRGRVTTTRRPMNIATKKNKVKSPLKRSHLAHEVDKGQENEDEGEDDEEEEEDEEVDVLPETWPRPGEGMYAKIAPETDDGSLLADANDEEAFSQFFVNKMGRQMVDPV